MKIKNNKVVELRISPPNGEIRLIAFLFAIFRKRLFSNSVFFVDVVGEVINFCLRDKGMCFLKFCLVDIFMKN